MFLINIHLSRHFSFVSIWVLITFSVRLLLFLCRGGSLSCVNTGFDFAHAVRKMNQDRDRRRGKEEVGVSLKQVHKGFGEGLLIR